MRSDRVAVGGSMGRVIELVEIKSSKSETEIVLEIGI